MATKRLSMAGGGRELLGRLHHEILKQLYGDRFLLHEFDARPVRGLKETVRAFTGNIDGLTSESIRIALDVIEANRVAKVFIDGSNLGAFAKAVKRRFPQVEVCTFFHHVEASFFWSAFRGAPGLHAAGVVGINYVAERMAVRFSDKLVALSKRDQAQLKRLYGRAATHVSPMAVRDFAEGRFGPAGDRGAFVLFVGGLLFASRSGITWFVHEVAPRIALKTCIVGRGFERLRAELELPGKVDVIGGVEDLAAWYRDCHTIIAPIFEGGGMKTKVAEALMFGRRVIGGPEAFVGYEDIADQVGRICTTADQFVEALAEAESGSGGFDPTLRAIYEKNYSFEAARDRLHAILESPTPAARDTWP